ncbi:DUF2971 domain-containing protein [Acinetobacter sp. YH12064]|nr:DUF2971 domain-containing protein [Acinetobacter sp. YH12064]
MWSHYGDSYKGVVIGIDTCKAGLEDGDQFIIPSTKGELRYLKTAPKQANVASVEKLMSVGNSNILNWDNEEVLIKHSLLYTMQEWAYEEEVRIVKILAMLNSGITFLQKHMHISMTNFGKESNCKRVQFIH